MSAGGTAAWAVGLQDWRRRKDAHFATGQGPVQGEALRDFAGLSYFAPSAAWRLEAALEPPEAGAVPEFELETNTGELRHMALLGQVTLNLPGDAAADAARLSVFVPLGETQPARAFVPFRDATSGGQTYGAGRYIDAPLVWHTPEEATVQLDFNMAYHPYCAYGEGWTCPLPPAENRLPQAVLAGERLP